MEPIHGSILYLKYVLWICQTCTSTTCMVGTFCKHRGLPECTYCRTVISMTEGPYDAKRFKHMKEDRMTISALQGISPYDSDYGSKEIDEILRQHEDYICALARDRVPRHLVSPELLDLEIQELAQRSRIRLWRTLQKTRITYIKAYIRSIVHSVSIDMIRGYKSDLPLPLDEDGEIYQGNVLVTCSEGMQDPLYELEQQECVSEYITQVVDLLSSFPLCQRRAMVCSLKNQLDDILTITQVFKNFEINIEAVRWPSKKKEEQNLRASLSVTRKKLRSFNKHNVRGSPSIVTGDVFRRSCTHSKSS